MKYATLKEVAPVARVRPVDPTPPGLLRRNRLERLASLLETSQAPVRLFSRAEYLPNDKRMELRDDLSPLALAYADPVLREQGLKSDRLGDGIAFFDLSWTEAHHLWCDCHYAGNLSGSAIAARMRSLAQRRTLGEILSGCWNVVRRCFA